VRGCGGEVQRGVEVEPRCCLGRGGEHAAVRHAGGWGAGGAGG